MNVTIQGTAGAINLPDDFPEKPTEYQVDELMRALSDVLGERWGAVKISGYWIIGRTEDGWKPVYGHNVGEQTRKFVKALANATGRAVVSTVPIK